MEGINIDYIFAVMWFVVASISAYEAAAHINFSPNKKEEDHDNIRELLQSYEFVKDNSPENSIEKIMNNLIFVPPVIAAIGVIISRGYLEYTEPFLRTVQFACFLNFYMSWYHAKIELRMLKIYDKKGIESAIDFNDRYSKNWFYRVALFIHIVIKLLLFMVALRLCLHMFF